MATATADRIDFDAQLAIVARECGRAARLSRHDSPIPGGGAGILFDGPLATGLFYAGLASRALHAAGYHDSEAARGPRGLAIVWLNRAREPRLHVNGNSCGTFGCR